MESDAFPRVKIGSLTWAAQDLQVSKFRNGEPIPLVKEDKEWAQLNSAAYCIAPGGYYLYNWSAVNDPRGLAPAGWHVPTDEEWEDLVHYLAQTLGDEDLVGAALKDDVAWNGTNSSGFSALPGGFRDYALETSTIRATTGTGGLPPRMGPALGTATCSLDSRMSTATSTTHGTASLSVVSGIDDNLTIRLFDSFFRPSL